MSDPPKYYRTGCSCTGGRFSVKGTGLERIVEQFDEPDHNEPLQTEIVEPPRKRLRRERDHVIEGIPVLRPSVSFQYPGRCPCQLVSTLEYASNEIRTHLLEFDTAQMFLELSCYEGLKRVPLLFEELHVPDDVLEEIRIVCAVSHFPEHTPSRKESKGMIWVETKFVLTASENGGSEVTVFWTVFWNIGIRMRPPHAAEVDVLRQIGMKVIPDHLVDYGRELHGDGITFQMVYDSFDVPLSPDVVADDLEVRGLQAGLFPYQKRSVSWMLKKEGVEWSLDKHTVTNREFIEQPPDLFHKAVDVNQNEFSVSPTLRCVTRPEYQPDVSMHSPLAIRGGLLLEEMGLGKTLEIIALILLHRREIDPLKNIVLDGIELFPIKSTLIITPEIIVGQWESELKRHAPGIRSFRYRGIQGHPAWTEFELLNHMTEQDVVFVTYEVLKREQYYAYKPVQRSLRDRTTSPRRSPLTIFSWWRIVLDEVQMLGTGGESAAARVASEIPRVNSWGVSGTPLQNNMNSLKVLLDFLRYEPAFDKALWTRLWIDDRSLLFKICKFFGVRHTKRMVRHELQIPPQTRYVISVPFGAVEEQAYLDLFQAMCEDCQLSLRGERLKTFIETEPGEPHLSAKLKVWLTRLRSSASFPHTDSGQARNGKNLAVKDKFGSVDNVLDALLHARETNLQTAKRRLVGQKIERAKFLNGGYGQFDPQSALRICQEALVNIEFDILDCQQQLALSDSNSKPSDLLPLGLSDFEEGHRPQDQNGQKHIYSLLVLQHTAAFLCANAYFQLKTELMKSDPGSKEIAKYEALEVEGYDAAKRIRQHILRNIYDRCCNAMNKLSSMMEWNTSSASGELDLTLAKGNCGDKGILEISQLNRLIECFDEQSQFLQDMREATLQGLKQRLVDADDEQEVTGDEYDASTKLQEELVIYNQLFWFSVEDRSDMLTGHVNPLVRNEAKNSLSLASSGKGPAPQTALEMLGRRSALQAQIPPGKSVAGLILEFTELVRFCESQRHTAAKLEEDLRIFRDRLQKLKEWLPIEQKAISKLRSQYQECTRVVNLRVEYYRQLQQISDQVTDWNEEGYKGIQHRNILPKMLQDEEKTEREVASLSTRVTYYKNLQSDEASIHECPICMSEVDQAAVVVCGHTFCKECLKEWTKQSKTCPKCKHAIKQGDIFFATYKPGQLKVVEETPTMSRTANGNASALYKPLSEEKLREIDSIRLYGPTLTAKIRAICKQVLWLRESDPGAKILIFSQYRHFIGILERAFDEYKIGYTDVKSKEGIQEFRNDPGMECFLMDALTQSSGLNLTVASHVFLCEPLLHTSIELQAISRVHRIGQTRPTTVWLFIIEGTVEENINAIAVRRRLQHVTQFQAKDKGKGKGKGKARDDGEDEDRMEALEAADLRNESEAYDVGKVMEKNRAEGEAVDQGDVWDCLFANRQVQTPAEMAEQEEIEDLIRNARPGLSAEQGGGERVDTFETGQGTSDALAPNGTVSSGTSPSPSSSNLAVVDPGPSIINGSMEANSAAVLQNSANSIAHGTAEASVAISDPDIPQATPNSTVTDADSSFLAPNTAGPSTSPVVLRSGSRPVRQRLRAESETEESLNEASSPLAVRTNGVNGAAGSGAPETPQQQQGMPPSPTSSNLVVVDFGPRITNGSMATTSAAVLQNSVSGIRISENDDTADKEEALVTISDGSISQADFGAGIANASMAANSAAVLRKSANEICANDNDIAANNEEESVAVSDLSLSQAGSQLKPARKRMSRSASPTKSKRLKAKPVPRGLYEYLGSQPEESRFGASSSVVARTNGANGAERSGEAEAEAEVRQEQQAEGGRVLLNGYDPMDVDGPSIFGWV